MGSAISEVETATRPEPTSIARRRPIRCRNAPAGMSIASVPNAAALTASAISVLVTPKSDANRGMVVTSIPWPKARSRVGR